MMALTSDKLYGKATSIADLPSFALNLSKRKQSIFRHRESIPSDGGSLWEISRGIVQVSTLDEDGTFISLGFWGSGDIVGSFLSGITPYQIECLTDVEAIALQCFDSCSASALLAHARQMEEFLQIVQQRMIKKRLMFFLSWLFSRFGQNTHDGKQLNLHLTHQEIAEAIGTTRVTITRLMKELQQEEFLHWSKRSHLLFYSNAAIVGMK